MSYNFLILNYCKNFYKNFYNNVFFFIYYLNNICFYTIGTYSCGDIIFCELLISFSFNLILDFKYRLYGCGSAISSISLTSSFIIKKTFYKIYFLKNYHISSELNLPSIKYHCSVLVENLFIFILNNFKNNFLFFFF